MFENAPVCVCACVCVSVCLCVYVQKCCLDNYGSDCVLLLRLVDHSDVFKFKQYHNCQIPILKRNS